MCSASEVSNVMAPMVAHSPAIAPRKPLRMRGESLSARGETHPKPLRTDEFKRLIGRAIESALRNADIQKKAAAETMGYGENMASLSNWISGNETPQFAKLWELGPRFQQQLVIALAREIGMGVTVKETVEIERRLA